MAETAARDVTFALANNAKLYCTNEIQCFCAKQYTDPFYVQEEKRSQVRRHMLELARDYLIKVKLSSALVNLSTSVA